MDLNDFDQRAVDGEVLGDFVAQQALTILRKRRAFKGWLDHAHRQEATEQVVVELLAEERLAAGVIAGLINLIANTLFALGE